MDEISAELSRRFKEVDEIIKLVVALEQQAYSHSDSRSAPVMKAVVLLMLYNCIEGVMCQCFECLFDSISDHCEECNDLEPSAYKQYQKYWDRKQETVNGKPQVEFSDYIELCHIFSGNLDARRIRDILKEWGIQADFHCSRPEEEHRLLAIKSRRNSLAHGDKSFSEVGRVFAASEIRQFADITRIYLESVIDVFDNYIQQQRFVKQ